MLRADEAARKRDGAAFVAALEAELEDAPEQLSPGGTLAVAELAGACGVLERNAALHRAEERVPGDALIGRALLRVDDDPERSALRWTVEGKTSSGARSAFAFTMAARLAQPGSEQADGACEAALAREDDYLPTLWELEDRLGSNAARATSASRQAALNAADRASSLLRASIWTPSRDERAAYANAALDRSSPDPLLVEHIVRCGRQRDRDGRRALGAGRAPARLTHVSGTRRRVVPSCGSRKPSRKDATRRLRGRSQRRDDSGSATRS